MSVNIISLPFRGGLGGGGGRADPTDDEIYIRIIIYLIQNPPQKEKSITFLLTLSYDYKRFQYFFIINFHPLEVVSRYRDPQLQVCENVIYQFLLYKLLFNQLEL